MTNKNDPMMGGGLLAKIRRGLSLWGGPTPPTHP